MFDDKALSKLDQKIDQLKSRIKGLEDLKVSDDVFDRFTLLTLYDLSNRGYFDVLFGSIKTGKESNVFLAEDKAGTRYAVKIHRILTSDFNAMSKYVDGDYRFKNVKRTRRNLIITWVEKEFRNLGVAFRAGINVPMPIVWKNNVIIMEFIGDGPIASPTLKDVKLKTDEVFEKIINDVKLLYQADLVHGDLSEYNILMRGEQPIIIDLSQAVPLNHPMAQELLERDLRNISRFFGKKIDKVYNTIVN
jgi:RIO kinase 1